MGRRFHNATHRLLSVVVLTLPIILLVAGYYVSSLRRLADVKQWDDWWSRPKTQQSFLGYSLRGLIGAPSALRLEQDLNPESDDPGALRLFADRSLWDRMSSHPQQSFGRWFEAQVHRGGALHPVEYRLRGDTSVHWATEKISITLRAPREDLFQSQREVALSVKDVLPQYFAGQIAQDFEILATETSIVPLYLNDRFLGMYRAIEVPGESFLRRKARLPGNILRGDTAALGEAYTDVRPLFYNTRIWDRVSANTHPLEAARTRLQSVLRDLHDPKLEARRRFRERFDLPEIGRLLAFLLLVGDPYHQSDFHNQYWYEDPADGRFHPIPWDVYFRPLSTIYGKMNRILSALLREPAVAEFAFRCLHEKLSDPATLRKWVHELEEQERRHASGLSIDMLRRGAVSRVGNARELRDLLYANASLLQTWIADARFVTHSGHVRDDLMVLDLESRGRVGGDLVGLRCDDAELRARIRRIVADTNRNGILDSKDRSLPLRDAAQGETTARFATPEPLLAGADRETPPWVGAPLGYRFFVEVAPDPTRPLKLSPELKHRLTQETLLCDALKPGQSFQASSASHPWDVEARKNTTRRLRGEVTLAETLVVEAGDVLELESGTQIKLGRDVSIFSRGKILSLGTEAAPVSLEALDPAFPFGAVVLLGDGARGSHFAHTRFVRGGGASLEGIDFKGMVSAHHVPAITFEHCEFRDNIRSDDALNAVHCDVVIRHCRFERANSDALDLDISTGHVFECFFADSRNDGIDCMTSKVTVIGNKIFRSGDKGISIGEGSEVLVLRNHIEECTRGIEVKDGSTASISGNTLINNRTGVRAAAKNWRYGRGGIVKHSDSDGGKSLGVLDVGGSSILVPVGPSSEWAVFEGALETSFGLRHSGVVPNEALGQAPLGPMWKLEFQDKFERRDDGFVARGSGFGRLDRRDRALRLALDRGESVMERSLDLNLKAPGAVLALDLSQERVRGLSVEADVDGKTLSVAMPLGAVRGILLLTLPAGRLQSLRIRSSTETRDGRVLLHTVSLYQLPDLP